MFDGVMVTCTEMDVEDVKIQTMNPFITFLLTKGDNTSQHTKHVNTIPTSYNGIRLNNVTLIKIENFGDVHHI